MTSTGSADAHLLARTAVSVTDTTAVTDGSRSQARLSGAAAGTASVGTSGEDETTALQGAVGALNLGSASGGPVAADTQRPPSAGGHMVRNCGGKYRSSRRPRRTYAGLSAVR